MHVYNQLDESLYFNPKVQILYGIWKNGVKPKVLRNLGDPESVELSYNIEEVELLRNDTTIRTVARTDVVQKSGQVNMAPRQLIPIIKEAMYLGVAKNVLQPAVASRDVEFTDLKVGDILETGLLDISLTGVEADVGTFVAGEHLNADSPTGRIEVLALPEDYAGGDGVITVSAPEITGAAGRTEIGILAGDGVIMRLVLRGLHPNGDDIIIPKIKFRVDGNLVLASEGTDFANVSMVGTIMTDITEPAGRQMGYAISIPVAA